MYTLRKTKLEEGSDSLLWEGYQSNLPTLSIYNHEDDTKEVLDSIQDIKVGWQVMLTSLREYHITSPVQEILKSSPEMVVFKSRTSIYELTGGV